MTKIASRFVIFFPLFLAIGCGASKNNAKNPNGVGPAPVSLSSSGGATVTAGDLTSAGNYTILAKTGIKNTGGSSITGNIGASPVTSTGITGFSLTGPVTDSSTSALVVGGGKVYAPDYAAPTPANLTTAILNIQTAYTDAVGRAADSTELGAGNIGGLTITPGTYSWTTVVNIATDVTLKGNANDTWIFQTSKDITMAAAAKVILVGAQAKNIVWAVAGQVTIGTTAQFSGIILSQTGITLQTNASMNGRLFAQSLVTLDTNAITPP